MASANLGGSNKLLSTTAAAEYLDIPVRTLRDNRRAWGIPATRIGRELHFRQRDLDAWVTRRLDAGQ
jgi:excisionase family DNA binding protein